MVLKSLGTEYPLPGVQNVQIVDDFEDGDVAEYTGDTASFTTGTMLVKNGAAGLEGTAASGGYVQIESLSGSGLDNYPSESSPYRVWVQWDSVDAALSIYYSIETDATTDGYTLNIRNDRIRLLEYTSSGYNEVGVSNAGGRSANTPYEVKLDWTNGGTHTATVYNESGTEQDSLSGTASNTRTGTGVAWAVNDRGSSGVTGAFDYARVIA